MASTSHEEIASSSEGEIQFLIAKYLQNGPYKDVGDLLVKKLEDGKSLPKRVDWQGQEHDVDFDELNETYSHVPPDYLVKVAENFGSNLDEGSRQNNVEGVSSLLHSAGCGRLDPLRRAEDSRKARWGTKQLLYSRNPWTPRTLPLIVAKNSRGKAESDEGKGDAIIPSLPGWPQLAIAGQISGLVNPDTTFSKVFYSKFELHKRILGHLAAVFNVLFDKSGKFLLTGSDDRLLKLWNVADGRLLFTFRGHSNEVVIMAINDENTMLASVATDRTIRIWDLQTGAQIVVHKCSNQYAFISSLKFSPSVRGNYRFLIASAMDGTITIWKYDKTTLKFAPGEVIINERVGEQSQTKICSMSLSSGGTFLASGCSEGFLRVYNLMADGGTNKIFEKRLHSERVDSVEYCHVGDRVLTGSRDGTGRIWLYRRQEWFSIMLNSAQTLKIAGSDKHDPRAFKRRVTMVGWSRNDQYALIASDDWLIRVFDSYDGRMVFELIGHSDSVYVLESHPFDTNIYLTAGHDARLVIWSLLDGTMLCRFEQWITGHGASPFVDAKWSPCGTMFAATDMFGSLNIYGRGSGATYSQTPEEQFFHTDYRPLMKDHAGFVVDEQTQLAPNLMQPAFLVSAAGVPYPPNLQKLVPGRRDSEEQMNVPAEPLPALDAALQALNNQAQLPPGQVAVQEAVGIQYDHPPDPFARVYVPQPLDRRLAASMFRRHQELAVLEIERFREQKALTKDTSVRNKDGTTVFVAPPKALTQKLEQMQRLNNENPLVAEQAQQQQQQNLLLFDEDDSEDEDFRMEEQPPDSPSEMSEELSDAEISIASVEARARQRDNGQPQENGVRRSNRKRKRSDSGSEKENSIMAEEEVDEVDYEGPSTSRGPPPLRSSRAAAKKKTKPPITSREKKLQSKKKKKMDNKKSVPSKLSRKKPKKSKRIQKDEKPRVLPEERSFPKWLTETVPKPAPYFPQIGDVVYYYQEGHEKYVRQVMDEGITSKLFKGMPRPQWNFKEVEELEIVALKFVNVSVKPQTQSAPTIHHIAEIEMKRIGVPPNGKTFKISFHEMPDIEDFLVLQHHVLRSQNELWQEGARVKSLFWDKGELRWYKGTIESVLPDAPGMYHMLKVRWEGSEDAEPISPWDLHLITPEEEELVQDGAIVTAPELRSMAYQPTAADWNDQDPDTEINRILEVLHTVSSLNEAEQFAAPVDLERYPDYVMEIAYPVDLNTIQQRLSQRFYRHKAALIFDFKQIASNCEKYNLNSTISMHANFIADICTDITNDSSTSIVPGSTYMERIKKKWRAEFEARKKSEAANGRAAPSVNAFVDSSILSDSEEEKSADDDNDSEFSLQPGDDEPSDEEMGVEPPTVAEDMSDAPSEDDDDDDGYNYGRKPRPQRKKAVPVRLCGNAPKLRYRPRPGQLRRDSASDESEMGHHRASRQKAAKSAKHHRRMARRKSSSGAKPLRNHTAQENGVGTARSMRSVGKRKTVEEPTMQRLRKRSAATLFSYAESDLETNHNSPAESGRSSASMVPTETRSGRKVKRPGMYEP